MRTILLSGTKVVLCQLDITLPLAKYIGNHMRKSTLILAITLAAAFFSAKVTNGGTIPAGTVLNVKTLDSIYTKDRVGREFTVALDSDLTVKGTVVAPAGTKFIGKIITSTKVGNSPLSIDLTGVSVNGRVVPVRTSGPLEPQSISRGRKRQVTTRDFVLPPGSNMQFHLAQPVTI